MIRWVIIGIGNRYSDTVMMIKWYNLKIQIKPIGQCGMEDVSIVASWLIVFHMTHGNIKLSQSSNFQLKQQLTHGLPFIHGTFLVAMLKVKYLPVTLWV